MKPGLKGIKKSEKNTVGFEPGSLLPGFDRLPIELMTQTCDTGCPITTVSQLPVICVLSGDTTVKTVKTVKIRALPGSTC